MYFENILLKIETGFSKPDELKRSFKNLTFYTNLV